MSHDVRAQHAWLLRSRTRRIHAGLTSGLRLADASGPFEGRIVHVEDVVLPHPDAVNWEIFATTVRLLIVESVALRTR